LIRISDHYLRYRSNVKFLLQQGQSVMKLWNMNASYDDSKFEMAPDRATNALEELVRLANLQEERVLATWAAERKSGLINPRLDRMIRIQKRLLLSIPELLFDLGLEDCKRRTPWEHTVMVETRRAEREARCAEAYARAEKILEKRLGKRSQVDAHPKERTTDAEVHKEADCNRKNNRAEPVGPVSPVEPVQALSVLEKLVRLEHIQDQRVLALRAEENKTGFLNPRLDSAIRLHGELLVSVQALTFDLGLERYQRRSPREQVAEYWEQEQRNQRTRYEVYKAADEILSQAFSKCQVQRAPLNEDTGK
jgi:hypothetical protein